MYCSCTVGRRETNPPRGESEFLPSPNRCSSGRISFPQKPAGRSDVQTSRLERVADVGVERVVLTFVAAGTERVVDAEREGVLLSRKAQGCLHRRAVNNAGDDFGDSLIKNWCFQRIFLNFVVFLQQILGFQTESVRPPPKDSKNEGITLF